MSHPIIKKVTMKQAGRIIETRNPLGLFYALDAGVTIGIDNSTGNAWTEALVKRSKFNYRGD